MATCCELFWSSGLEGKALVIHLDEQFPNFGCEKQTCSPYSPCPVDAAEEIAFLLIEPLHYDPVRKTVVPDAFQEITNRDLSVLRLKYATKREAVATRNELVKRGADRPMPKLREVDEACTAQVSEIRAEVAAVGRRLIGVLDTALPGSRSHASIVTSSEVLNSRPLRKIVRERVHEIMTRSLRSFGSLLDVLPE